VEFSATVTRRLPAASVLAALLCALTLLASAPSASASNLKTRVWDFFEDRTLCTDGEPDLSTQSSSGKTASNASDCGGRNLFYNRFRYYDPAVGRYISPDPIGLLGGANAYGYTPSTTGAIDPYGLANQRVCKTQSPA
jgi:RHS repeat-associated protein